MFVINRIRLKEGVGQSIRGPIKALWWSVTAKPENYTQVVGGKGGERRWSQNQKTKPITKFRVFISTTKIVDEDRVVAQ